MSNEEIAKELLSVLKEKMMYREGLPSDGWAIEVIGNALVAAQQSVQADGLKREHKFDCAYNNGGMCNCGVFEYRRR